MLAFRCKSLSPQTAEKYIKRYQELVKEEINQAINLISYIPDYSEPFYYAQHCHEAMLAFAYALDRTITGKCFFVPSS